jgi:hypothetical protein
MTPRTTATSKPQVSVQEFEELARRSPEFVRWEFIDGKVEVKADGNHGEIVMWPLKRCMQQRPDPVGITLETEKLKDYSD